MWWEVWASCPLASPPQHIPAQRPKGLEASEEEEEEGGAEGEGVVAEGEAGEAAETGALLETRLKLLRDPTKVSFDILYGGCGSMLYW